MPVRHLELDHVYLQLQAAVDGLGAALASLPLIEADIAAGRLVVRSRPRNCEPTTINLSSEMIVCVTLLFGHSEAGFSPPLRNRWRESKRRYAKIT